MAKGIEVAQAYVTIIPSMKGIQGDIAKQLGAETIGNDAGKKLGEGIVSGLGGAAAKVAEVVAKTVAVGTAAAAASLAAMSKASLDSYAQFEQLAGGAQQIFSGMDYDKIASDAQRAYVSMGMSANDYLASINQVGAAFKATMGDEKGYDTAKRGMQAISDYASGTGRSVDELNEKYAMITRSTSSYQSIADQFSGILPATSKDFLEQAQAAGLLSDRYKSLTEVPISEYQQAVTGMLERGVDSLNLTGNTAREATETITGSMDMLKGSWANFLTELGKDDADIEARVNELVDSAIAVFENAAPRLLKIVGALLEKVPQAIAEQAPKIAQAMTDLLDGMTDGAFSKVVAKIQPSVEKIGTAISGLMERLAPLAPYAQQIGSAFGSILVTAFRAVADIISWLAPIIASVAEHALPVLATAMDMVASAFEAGLTAIEPFYDFVSGVLATAIDWLGEQIQSTVELIAEAFQWLGDAFGAVGDFLEDPLNSVLDFGKGVTKSFGDTGKSVTKTATSTGRSVEKTFGKMSDGAVSSAKRMQKGVTSEYGAMDKGATKTFGGMAKTVSSKMSAIYKDVSGMTGSAASAAEKNSSRISTTWNKKYKMQLDSEASTAAAESKLSKFVSSWDKKTVNFLTDGSTSGVLSKFNPFWSSWHNSTVNFNSSGSTSGVLSKFNPFWNSWNGSTVHFYSSGDTSSADYAFSRLYSKWNNSKVNFFAGGIAYATGGIVQKHADGFIANRPGDGVDITRHIAGEAGAEAIIPLTNKHYVRPFAETVAEFIEPSGVTITGNTFIVRDDRDISAIGRAVGQEVDRQRRSQL